MAHNPNIAHNRKGDKSMVYAVQQTKKGTFQVVLIKDEVHCQVDTILSEVPHATIDKAWDELWELVKNPAPWEMRVTVRYMWIQETNR
jgi:hypothetical protein